MIRLKHKRKIHIKPNTTKPSTHACTNHTAKNSNLFACQISVYGYTTCAYIYIYIYIYSAHIFMEHVFSHIAVGNASPSSVVVWVFLVFLSFCPSISEIRTRTVFAFYCSAKAAGSWESARRRNRIHLRHIHRTHTHPLGGRPRRWTKRGLDGVLAIYLDCLRATMAEEQHWAMQQLLHNLCGVAYAWCVMPVVHTPCEPSPPSFLQLSKYPVIDHQ